MKKNILLSLTLVMSLGAMALPQRGTRVNTHPRQLTANLNSEAPKDLSSFRTFDTEKHKDAMKLPSPVTDPSLLNSTSSNTRGTSDPFFGYMVYSSVDQDLGVYRIMPGRGYRMYIVDPYEQLGFDLMPDNGWYSDGKINGLSMFYLDYNTPMGYFYYSMDFETGELLEYDEYYDWFKFDLVFKICTLNPDDGYIYGYAVDINDDEWKYYWAWATPEDPTNIHIIKEAEEEEQFISICYKAEDQLFYGITSGFDFVSIDVEGEVNYINYVPYYEDAVVYGGLLTGLIWDSEDEVFYWNAQIYDYRYEYIFGFLFSITEDGDFEPVEQYSMDQQFSFFFKTSVYVNPDLPMEPVIDSIDFEGAALEGTMTVTLPATYGDESPLPSSIEYNALLDGKVFKTGTAAPGSTVKVDYNVETQGEHTFGFYVNADGKESKKVKIVKYIGYDTPVAVTDILLTPSYVKWDAVTQGVHGGFIDVKELTYVVSINGENVGNTSETKLEIDLLKNPGLKPYTATVFAVNAELEGEAKESNTIIAGEPVKLPLSYEPTEEQFATMTIYNANEDWYMYDPKEITWELSSHGLFSGGTEWKNIPMDDYIFLPPVYMTKGNNNYNLTFDTGMHMDWYPEEYLNVVYADSPCSEGVQGEILSQYNPKVFLSDKNNNWTEWDTVKLDFSVPETGVYYIGFQCVSAPQQYGIYIQNIVLTGKNEAGVEEISSDANKAITTLQGMIVLKGFAGERVVISGLDGKVVYKGKVNENSVEYSVNPGIYVVKAGTSNAKVIVR